MGRRTGEAVGGTGGQLRGWKGSRRDGKAAGQVEGQLEKRESNRGVAEQPGEVVAVEKQLERRGLGKAGGGGAGRGRKGEIAGRMEKQPGWVRA